MLCMPYLSTQQNNVQSMHSLGCRGCKKLKPEKQVCSRQNLMV